MREYMDLTGNGALLSLGVLVGISRRCRAEVASELLDERGEVLESLIDFAIGTLDVHELDIRIVPSGSGQSPALL